MDYLHNTPPQRSGKEDLRSEGNRNVRHAIEYYSRRCGEPDFSLWQESASSRRRLPFQKLHFRTQLRREKFVRVRDLHLDLQRAFRPIRLRRNLSHETFIVLSW